MLVSRYYYGYSNKKKHVTGKGFVDSLSSIFNTLKSATAPVFKTVENYVSENKDLIAKPILGALGSLAATGLRREYQPSSVISQIGQTGADPGIYFGGGPNQGPQSKVNCEARIEGAKRPSIEGKTRVEGAKRPRIEGEARTEGEAREKAGGGVWGGGSVSPFPENLKKITLETIYFEMTNEMVK